MNKNNFSLTLDAKRTYSLLTVPDGNSTSLFSTILCLLECLRSIHEVFLKHLNIEVKLLLQTICFTIF